MATRTTEVFARDEVTPDMLEDASRVFSENYGVWAKGYDDLTHGKPGDHVRFSPSRMQEQFLPPNSRSSYVKITVDGVLAGHAFACRWPFKGHQVLWITQLVVHRDYRERRLATTMLLALLDEKDEIFGIMSSHPAAIKTLAKAYGGGSRFLDPLSFAEKNASDVLATCPIAYIKDANPRGTLFSQHDTSGLICGVDTNFYVDHEEPQRALRRIRDVADWPYGDLPDGHEFLLLLDVTGKRSA